MRRIGMAVAVLTLAAAFAAEAQQGRLGGGSGGGFNFDRCLSRCMGMDDAYHCSRKCGRKQANFQWRQLEGKTISRSDPHHPRHPQFHDPDPHHHEHH
jgi:hypothetical protein